MSSTSKRRDQKPASVRLEVPDAFDLAATVRSHGWYQLAPFGYDPVSGGLSYVFRPARGKPFRAEVRQKGGSLEVTAQGRTSANALETAASGFRRILSTEADLSAFHESVSDDPSLSWLSAKRAGRLLRSPTVFEDLVKTICTTNCSWSLTRSMVSKLVEELGANGDGAAAAFPEAGDMAGVDEAFYRENIKAGYRSAYLLELSEAVASCKIDPESWLDPQLTTEELRKKLLAVKGVGKYAAENMLKLLGHFDGLALDSYLRSEFYKKHNRGRKCNDKKIERHYRKYGRWKGLAIWFDICGE